MNKRKFTVVAQLHKKNNFDIIEYVESTRCNYAKAVRETFYVIRSGYFNKSQYNTYLQHEYGIVKRTANSIISDAQSRFNALKEFKRYEKGRLELKIKYLETNVIPKLVKLRNQNSIRLRSGEWVSVVKQRNLRLKIVAKKAKLNRLKQKLRNLNYQLKSKNLKFCFGTKYLLKRDYNRFVEQRDNQMSFVGAKGEKACNQLLQLTYNQKNNQFLIQLRKDFGEYKSAKGDAKYAYGKVYFNCYKNTLYLF